LVRTGCRASGNLPAAGELVPVDVSPLGYLHPSAIMRISREASPVDLAPIEVARPATIRLKATSCEPCGGFSASRSPNVRVHVRAWRSAVDQPNSMFCSSQSSMTSSAMTQTANTNVGSGTYTASA
jgi:hypothetical protein